MKISEKYLVIGASGMLGYELAARLGRNPRNEVVGSWRSFEFKEAGFPMVRLDLAKSRVGEYVREFKPGTVYHLASETKVDFCEKDPQRVYEPIQTGLFSLIDACNRTGAKLVFISSDGIFGRDEGPHYEDTLPSPVNVYGKSKVLSEGLIISMCRRWVIVRCCPVGRHPLRKKGLICWLERQIENNQPITGWTDCRFSPLTVSSLAERLIRIQTLENRIIHLYSYPGITKYDFLAKLVKILDGPPELVCPGKMLDACLKVPRPKSQVLSSKEEIGKELASPIEQEFTILKETLVR